MWFLCAALPSPLSASFPAPADRCRLFLQSATSQASRSGQARRALQLVPAAPAPVRDARSYLQRCLLVIDGCGGGHRRSAPPTH
ncbi:hypothetical protein GUJ93_ZPchr0004g39525 [Zizania palustris]|uniref:Uncharacterized protein n=1 Tax=Zizania palustris TaxID=103762 RepID=A0A8J5S1K2_ZIZPA|nr:hypothetical protein GUJ93_ZPchr0004g39525 [Zizania palustris]